ncbi:MAG: hypothetical protein ACKO1F_13315 [Flammeovirgaceae bacterium]
MEQTQSINYNKVSLLSIAILIVLIWGFYRTYIAFFPSFEGFLFIQHFHGVIMLLWMLMLIAQPLLIARRKNKLHKTIGKFSYVLAPILMVSIFLVSRMTFYRNLEVLPPRQDAIAMVALSLPGLINFGILYTLAIANKQKTFYHMRYMIGTALLMIGPGLGRILGVNFGVAPDSSGTISLFVIVLLATLFLIADTLKKRDYYPNLIVAALMSFYLVAWQIRYSGVWQGFAEVFAKLFF